MGKVLVAGGAGYIGSHTVVELIKEGFDVVIVDNFSNSSPVVLDRLEKITGVKPIFYETDCSDKSSMSKIFEENDIDSVILFAGLKAVGESVEKPLTYYRNNLDCALTVLELMNQYGVKKIVFSSSATVYGDPQELPLKEDSPKGDITNPYGQTKAMIEQILKDLCIADQGIEVTALRYFNPLGAHESGLIGEDPDGPPNNLPPYISQTAAGKRDKVMVFGNDYDTPDGTGVRDYIHIADLCSGHVAALQNSKPGYNVYNLGTGQGTSVLELIKFFEKASGKAIAYEVVGRRSGDIATCYASADKAAKDINWRAMHTIEEACASAWNWQSKNPNGYKK